MTTTNANGSGQIIDKRRNQGAAPPGARVETTTLPANPDPDRPPTWASGQPAGARPPVRPLGGGPAVAAAPSAPQAAPPQAQLSGFGQAWARLTNEQRALLERLPAPTWNVWAGDPPEEGKASLTDQIMWSLGNATVEQAREWFKAVAFPVWNALVAYYMVAGAPTVHWGAQPAASTDVLEEKATAAREELAATRANTKRAPLEVAEMTGADIMTNAALHEQEDFEDPSDEELAAAHAPLGASAKDPVEASGLAAAEAALKEEDRSARQSAPVKRMSKTVREQIATLVAQGASDAEISTITTFPVERIAEERKKLAPAPTPAAPIEQPRATTHGATEPVVPVASLKIEMPSVRGENDSEPSDKKTYQAALMGFLTSTVSELVGADPTFDEIDALASKLLMQLEAYSLFRQGKL